MLSGLAPCGEGDDDANLEEDFSNWKETIWPIVCGHLQAEQGGDSSGSTTPALEWLTEEITDELQNADSGSDVLRRGELTGKDVTTF